MNKVTLMVITDGRKSYLEQTMRSAQENLFGEIAHSIMVDDSCSPEYAAWLDATFPDFKIAHSSVRRGFAGAIQEGWRELPEETEWVIHLEDDFTFSRRWDLAETISILEAHQSIAQMCLRRQPWGVEPSNGGFIAQWPATYQDESHAGIDFLTHRNFFSTNPSLYPIRITKFGWPEGPDSEGKFGPKLWEAGYRCAFLGRREDSPRVFHIGDIRAGVGY